MVLFCADLLYTIGGDLGVNFRDSSDLIIFSSANGVLKPVLISSFVAKSFVR